jgi:hypothetical protein
VIVTLELVPTLRVEKWVTNPSHLLFAALSLVYEFCVVRLCIVGC